jgi:hypothetical protein
MVVAVLSDGGVCAGSMITVRVVVVVVEEMAVGMDDESDPGKDVGGRWIGGLLALVTVIWVVYMLVSHEIKVQSLPGHAL